MKSSSNAFSPSCLLFRKNKNERYSLFFLRWKRWGGTDPPREILAYCSLNLSLEILAMLSSRRIGRNALQMMKSAYMRSAVLLI